MIGQHRTPIAATAERVRKTKRLPEIERGWALPAGGVRTIPAQRFYEALPLGSSGFVAFKRAFIPPPASILSMPI
jgi:hypothetical protein